MGTAHLIFFMSQMWNYSTPTESNLMNANTDRAPTYSVLSISNACCQHHETKMTHLSSKRPIWQSLLFIIKHMLISILPVIVLLLLSSAVCDLYRKSFLNLQPQPHKGKNLNFPLDPSVADINHVLFSDLIHWDGSVCVEGGMIKHC